MPTTTISYIREGRPVRLVQAKTKTGLPCCVQCGRSIPAAYRRWDEEIRKRPAWFCTDACAITFANQVAGEAWVKP